MAAPKFNIVSKPNEWVKIEGRGQGSSTDLTETQQRKLEYRTAFCDYVLTQGNSVIRPRKPLSHYWMTFAVGRSEFDLEAFVYQTKQYIGVSLGIFGADAKAHFHLLKADQATIESQLGKALTWHEMPDKKSSYISLYLNPANPKNREDWSRQHAWLLDRLEAFYHCFVPRIKTLNAAEWNPPPE